jgi:hypothetical protein
MTITGGGTTPSYATPLPGAVHLECSSLQILQINLLTLKQVSQLGIILSIANFSMGSHTQGQQRGIRIAIDVRP